MSILETTYSVVCNSSILMSLNDGLMLEPNQNLSIIRCKADDPLIVLIEKTQQLKEVDCLLMAASEIYVVRANNVPKILLNSNIKAYCSQMVPTGNIEMVPWDNLLASPQFLGTNSINLPLSQVCHNNLGLTLPQVEKTFILNGHLMLNNFDSLQLVKNQVKDVSTYLGNPILSIAIIPNPVSSTSLD